MSSATCPWRRGFPPPPPWGWPRPRRTRSLGAKRDLYQVPSRELDALQEISPSQPGIHGCRLAGSGFGGCAVALIREEALASYLEEVPERYRRATGREPFLMPFRPAAWARRING
ncbi:MAG: hypothetical protein H5T72_04190 [Actinobacteria bacterium]|nr:hypothetical protein [Actinomycetota bacterium]